MKKGQVLEGTVEKVAFPNKGIVSVEDKKVILKNAVVRSSGRDNAER